MLLLINNTIRRPLLSGLLFFLLISIVACKHDRPSDTKPTFDGTKTSIKHPFASSDTKINHISAHRGGGDISGFPENCLESMKYINDKTGAWMEIDIRETKDKQLVLMHDASVDRTTNGNGKVKNISLSDLQTLKLKDNFGRETNYKPPTLEKVLRWNESEGHTVLNLDIKQGVDYRDVINLVKRTNQMDNVIGIVYTLDQAKAMRRIDKEIVISLPVRNMEEWERLTKSGLPLKNLIAFTGTIRSSKELYDTLHNNGMLTIFGTMGNIDRQAEKRGRKVYQELYDAGADILSTDRPLEVFVN